MPEPLRILMLEDNPADTGLSQFELEEAGIIFTAKVVMDEEGYVRAIQDYCPDIILSDYDLPKYNGALALAEANRRCPDTPFILVSGAVTEDRAIDILTQGAKDYVPKNRLQQRLGPAVRRALAEAGERRARKKAEDAVAAAHLQVQSIIDNATSIIYAFDPEGRFVMANATVAELLNSTPGQMIGRRRHEFMPKDDADWHEANDRQVIESGMALEFEEYSRLKDRSITWFTTKFPLRNAQGRIYGVAGISADISERKQAQELLRESEERYRGVVENTTAIIFRVDPSGVITFANSRTLEFFGYTADELIGRHAFGSIIPAHESTGRDLAAMVDQITAYPDRFHSNANENICRDGRRVWLEWTNSGIYHADGRLKEILCVGIDATAHKQAEQAVRQSEVQRSFLLELNDAFRQLDDPIQIQAAAARLLGECLQADRVFYSEIVVEDGIEYCVIELDYYRPGFSSLLGRFAFKEFSHTDYENYRAGRTVSSPNVFADGREASQSEAYRAVNVAAFIGVPLVKQGQLVSVLGVLQRHPRNWTPSEIILAEQTVDRTWHAVQRSRAERELRESEERLRSMAENVPCVLMRFDRQLRIAYLNMQADRYNPNPAEQMIGRTNREIGMPHHLCDLWDAATERVFRTGTQEEMEFDFAGPSGMRTFALKFAPEFGPDREIRYVLGVSSDITARKQAERKLRESEENYRSLFENLNAAALLVEPIFDGNGRLIDLRYLLANAEVEKQVGKTRDELEGKLYSEVFSYPGRDPVFDIYEKVLSSAEPFKGEIHLPAVNRYIDLAVYRPTAGKLALIMSDITESYKIKASLREKEVLLNEIHHRVKNNMQLMSSLLDLQARSTENPELTRLVNESKSRIRSMAMIHEKLYDSKDFTKIDLADYLRTLSQDLLQLYKTPLWKKDPIIQSDGVVYVDIGKAIPCGLILNELISNALKHAFSGDRQDKLQILINETEKTEIEIVVRDNGMGLPDNIDIHEPQTTGLYLVNGLVKNQLEGQIEVRRDNGTEFRIRFPL